MRAALHPFKLRQPEDWRMHWLLKSRNLTSTTAGIVSAKGRDLQNTATDSFIQTDAAVNSG